MATAIKPGQTCLLHGLQSQPSFNGYPVRVLEYIPEQGRFRVQPVDPSAPLPPSLCIKPSNLQPTADVNHMAMQQLQPGTRCTLHSLQTQHLNNHDVIILEFLPVDQRYRVQPASPQNTVLPPTLAIRPQNLRLADGSSNSMGSSKKNRRSLMGAIKSYRKSESRINVDGNSGCVDRSQLMFDSRMNASTPNLNPMWTSQSSFQSQASGSSQPSRDTSFQRNVGSMDRSQLMFDSRMHASTPNLNPTWTSQSPFQSQASGSSQPSHDASFQRNVGSVDRSKLMAQSTMHMSTSHMNVHASGSDSFRANSDAPIQHIHVYRDDSSQGSTCSENSLLVPGSKAVLQSIRGQPALNGQIVQILDFVPEKNRYRVEAEQNGQVMLIKSSSLRSLCEMSNGSKSHSATTKTASMSSGISTASSEHSIYRPGYRARLQRLRSRPNLNTHLVEVIDYVPEKGRYRVRPIGVEASDASTASILYVKHENLGPDDPTLAAGNEWTNKPLRPEMRAVVTDSSGCLNGEIVIVKEYLPARRAYRVGLLGIEAIKANHGERYAVIPRKSLQVAPKSAFWVRLTLRGSSWRLPAACRVDQEGRVRVVADTFAGIDRVVPAAKALFGESKCDWMNDAEVMETLQQCPSPPLTQVLPENDALLEDGEVLVDPTVSKQNPFFRAMLEYQLIQGNNVKVPTDSFGIMEVYKATFPVHPNHTFAPSPANTMKIPTQESIRKQARKSAAPPKRVAPKKTYSSSSTESTKRSPPSRSHSSSSAESTKRLPPSRSHSSSSERGRRGSDDPPGRRSRDCSPTADPDAPTRKLKTTKKGKTGKKSTSSSDKKKSSKKSSSTGKSKTTKPAKQSVSSVAERLAVLSASSSLLSCVEDADECKANEVQSQMRNLAFETLYPLLDVESKR